MTRRERLLATPHRETVGRRHALGLDRPQALQVLKMTVKGDHLFLEAGGFSEKNPVGWKTPLVVMKK